MEIWYLIIIVLGVIVLAGLAVPLVPVIADAARRQPDARVLERIEDLEARLAAVEKTLNDIP